MPMLTVYFQTEINIGISDGEAERIEGYAHKSNDRQAYMLELLNEAGVITPPSGVIDGYVIEEE